MNEIEQNHAKPSMADLIVGKSDILVDQSRAHSIALFGFKTAIIFDSLARTREPFFDRSVRHGFRISLTIPSNIRMWLTKFALPGRGEVSTTYLEGRPSDEERIEMYVCTYAVEYLVIQIIAFKQQGLLGVSTKDNFTAVPFWPVVDTFTWPPDEILRTVDDFAAFSDRWNNIMTVS
jgi:hypothetical protein